MSQIIGLPKKPLSIRARAAAQQSIGFRSLTLLRAIPVFLFSSVQSFVLIASQYFFFSRRYRHSYFR